MKKLRLLLLFVVVLCTTLILVSCTDKISENPITPEEEELEKVSTETNENEDKEVVKLELPRSNAYEVKEGHIYLTDKLDHEVVVPIKPQNVIALDFTSLDLWYLVGGKSLARTDHPLIGGRVENDLTKDIPGLPVIGGANDPISVEKLIELDTELVFISPTSKNHLDIIPILEKNDIKYIAWSYENFDEFLEMLEIFCAINDRMDLYEEYALDNIRRINIVKEKIKGQDPVPMVMLLPHAEKGVFALRNKGYLGNICSDLNTYNVAFTDGEGDGKNTIISMEKLIELDPYFILSRGGSGDGSEETALEIYETSPLWSELTAVKEGRFKHLPSELFLYRANTRYADAYEYLGKLLYPELF